MHLTTKTSILIYTLVCCFFCSAQDFEHPGLINNRAELDFIRSMVRGQVDPWYTAYENMSSTKFGSENYAHRAISNIECGYYNNPNIGCDRIVEDGRAVYVLALRWYITGQQRYATKAIKILKDWSNNFNSISNDNDNLVMAWAIPHYLNGAEILRTGVPNVWSHNDFNKFKSFVAEKWAPWAYENHYRNNAKFAQLEAKMATAIFLDDRNAYNDAKNQFVPRLATYVYQTTDGPEFVWINMNNKYGTTNYINGVGMETCRDFGHQNLGMFSAGYIAEMAFKQGHSFFDETGNVKFKNSQGTEFDIRKRVNERFRDYFELHFKWLTGKVPIPENFCNSRTNPNITSQDIFCLKTNGPVMPDCDNQAIAWELLYRHLAIRKDFYLPETLAQIKKIRLNPDRTVHRWSGKWEHLTNSIDMPFNLPQNNHKPEVSYIEPSGSNKHLTEGYDKLYVKVKATDPDGIVSVKFFIDNKFVRVEKKAPYEWGHQGAFVQETLGLEPGEHVLRVDATDSYGAVKTQHVKIFVADSQNPPTGISCDFRTPANQGLPSMDKLTFSKVYVLGNDGPSLQNFKKFTINYNANLNGLYQFSINTKNGNPKWYIDFTDQMSYQLKNVKPEVSLRNTGFAKLDGDYWITKTSNSIILVSKTKDFSIHFSNSNTAPTCDKNPGTLVGHSITVSPNPFDEFLSFTKISQDAMKIYIYDYLGKIVYETFKATNSGAIQLDTSSLPRGVYFTKILMEDGTFSVHKLIKSRS